MRGAYPSTPPPSLTRPPPSQIFFSVYHYHLARSISGLPQTSPRNLAELQASFERVLKTGLADLTIDEESLDAERPGSPAENLTHLRPDDPRAVEFRECMRAWYVLVHSSLSQSRLTPPFKVSQSYMVVYQEARSLRIPLLGLLQ